MIYTLREPWERAQGVLAFPAPFSPRDMLFFPQVADGTVMHMRGVTEPLNIFFLDTAMNVIRMVTLQPEDVVLVPPGVAHVVELSTKARPPQSFEPLKAQL